MRSAVLSLHSDLSPVDAVEAGDIVDYADFEFTIYFMIALVDLLEFGFRIRRLCLFCRNSAVNLDDTRWDDS